MTDYDSVGDIPVSELMHYGVKGMKWGVRKNISRAIEGAPDKSGVTRRDVRDTRRVVARKVEDDIDAFKSLRPRERDAEIRGARSGRKQAMRDLSDAQRDYRRSKQEIGKNAAKKILIESRANPTTTLLKSQTKTQQEELNEMIQNIFSGLAERRR